MITKFRRRHHEDLVRKADSVGNHFFAKDAMRFFNSRLIEEVFYSNDEGTVWVFATSEKMDDRPRRFTARIARLVNDEDGEWLDIDCIEGTEFQQFSRRDPVRKFIHEYVEA